MRCASLLHYTIRNTASIRVLNNGDTWHVWAVAVSDGRWFSRIRLKYPEEKQNFTLFDALYRMCERVLMLNSCFISRITYIDIEMKRCLPLTLVVLVANACILASALTPQPDCSAISSEIQCLASQDPISSCRWCVSKSVSTSLTSGFGDNPAVCANSKQSELLSQYDCKTSSIQGAASTAEKAGGVTVQRAPAKDRQRPVRSLSGDGGDGDGNGDGNGGSGSGGSSGSGSGSGGGSDPIIVANCVVGNKFNCRKSIDIYGDRCVWCVPKSGSGPSVCLSVVIANASVLGTHDCT